MRNKSSDRIGKRLLPRDHVHNHWNPKLDKEDLIWFEKNTKPAQFWPKQPKPAQFCSFEKNDSDMDSRARISAWRQSQSNKQWYKNVWFCFRRNTRSCAIVRLSWVKMRRICLGKSSLRRHAHQVLITDEYRWLNEKKTITKEQVMILMMFERSILIF